MKKKILIIFAGILLILAGAGFYLYNNFNKLLSNALMESFNTNIASDLYELEFKDLNVNLMQNSIKVKDVHIQPRKVNMKEYPYINSKIELTTKELMLSNVKIMELLKQKRLKLDRIKIENPEIVLSISGKIPIFLPFIDSTAVELPAEKSGKKAIEGFSLKNFDLTEASIHVENFAKMRKLNFKNLNISIRDLTIDQQFGKDLVGFSMFNFSIDELEGSLQKDSVKYVSLKDYGITIDTLKMQKTIDTMIYSFGNYNMGFRDLNLQTADSIFTLTMQSFSISYADSLIDIEKLVFKPNIDEAEMQKRSKFQHSIWLSANLGQLKISGIHFDTLLFKKKLMIRDVSLDSASVWLFKDKTKPLDEKHLPEYLGQSIQVIPLPLYIGQVHVTNADLVSREFKTDSTFAEAYIYSATATAKNITNLPYGKPLVIEGEAYLENKAHFKVMLNFDYKKPGFNYSGSFSKFKLTDLNRLIQDYAPASLSGGIIDGIEFTGEATLTSANGTMKFLYHDLNVDVQLEEKAKWKNSVLSFAANTVVASSNPVNEDQPPKIVKFHIERDMNKGFVNVIIRSALTGLKETVLMSKENKKAFREAKRKAKEEDKN